MSHLNRTPLTVEARRLLTVAEYSANKGWSTATTYRRLREGVIARHRWLGRTFVVVDKGDSTADSFASAADVDALDLMARGRVAERK